ncbi:alpha/beta fold hydrolase [Natranaerobius trueperi]|uniref:Alpha/beta hydrolase n=1 Tax=Natranaerobius trueperi TaxID=759412 RepID=A0A226C1H7_9FIRM|nr:alpha/beta hydrolase [Natranaerobius trueperi]OWZ85035.1 alpha/beta hydrolase [Natranaerobius trueperi]
MKKIFKWILVGVPILLIMGITFIVGGSYLEHRELLTQEKEDYPAPGTIVEINDNGDKLHVYSEGEGKKTLIFMSGFGTSSPVYDFKALYKKLSNDYRIVVVERAGYGWSDITSSCRDIDTVLEETRTALELSGESPPYVLFPHSVAGLEAIYWANLYPKEVKAIIGLDPLTPDYYEKTKEDPPLSRVITLLARTGLMRNQPNVFRDNFPAMEKGHLTEEEAKIAETIFFRRVQTKNMWEEASYLSDNSQTVSEFKKPDSPFHVFISSENEEKYWSECLISFAEETEGEHFVLDAGHYIHLDKPELIAEKSRDLIEKATKN